MRPWRSWKFWRLVDGLCWAVAVGAAWVLALSCSLLAAAGVLGTLWRWVAWAWGL